MAFPTFHVGFFFRDRLPEGASASFIVDRTIEHYRMVIEKRMKEREKIGMKSEYLEGQRAQQRQAEIETIVSVKI